MEKIQGRIEKWPKPRLKTTIPGESPFTTLNFKLLMSMYDMHAGYSEARRPAHSWNEISALEQSLENLWKDKGLQKLAKSLKKKNLNKKGNEYRPQAKQVGSVLFMRDDTMLEGIEEGAITAQPYADDSIFTSDRIEAKVSPPTSAPPKD